jgi:hypothetical protein
MTTTEITADEQAAYKAGYEAAVADGKRWLADCWAPAPLRWRHVQVGDVFIGAKQRQWMVSALATVAGSIQVTARQGADEFAATVDPDETIDVLTLTTEREAIELLRSELGAQLIERRTAA